MMVTTLNPLVTGSSPVRVIERKGGELKRVTLVTWAFAPEWLTIAQAMELSGYDEETMAWLVQDGALESKQEGDTWLVEKASLWDFQEALLDVRSV
ncbi:MAG: helix-turn-helix domain-containing protein [Sphaerochaeta sp.]|jgi:hypothetical protein|nr:helix-turn-helix domain-containing protein [Sphaerochaeta sp.]